MREYTKKPENQSRTLDSNPRASKQAPISEILQAYQDRTLGKPVQRQEIDDDALLQSKVNVAQREEFDEDKMIQPKSYTIQREELDDDELLQPKFESASTTEQTPIQREEKPNNTGLPDNLKTGVENLSGFGMDDVRVHYNSAKPAQLQALAYTQGTDIHVAPGQEQHLPHEAWHVVQQKQGCVQPTIQLQGVNVNDNEGLEREADMMGEKIRSNDSKITQYKQSGSLRHHSTQTIVQKRLADPTGLNTASEAVVNGAKAALVETLLDIDKTKTDKTWITKYSFNNLHRAGLTEEVKKLEKVALIEKIIDVRKDYPAQVFDSTKFDIKPTGGTAEETYINDLKVGTVAKMEASEGSDAILKQIFGDGNEGSTETQTAAATAKGKINEAKTGLNTFSNIYIDTSGISQRVGVGGYALCGKKIFLLVDNKALLPSNKAVSTLFHESMHLKHPEILDNGGYTATGESFRGRSIDEKLKNADHYAEVARVIDGESPHILPFVPVDPASKVTGAKTHISDTVETMNVRKNVMHRCRLLWSGAMDALLWAINESRNKDNWSRRNEMSKKLGMTYHRTSLFSTPYINETDLSLAEGTVNRIKRFNTQVTSEMNAPENNGVLNKINTALANTSKNVENAGKAILITEGEKSDILAPQDRIPSVEERFNNISRYN